MKIIDRLLIRSFLPPFVVTFLIASFVLVVQILWVYIDDLTGKGLNFFMIVELLGYKSVSLAPMALPLALLISSVMVLGNLAEHYELSSLKSAGVSLLRVMAPMIVFGVLCAALSYYCSDYLIPASNLKFYSRMYDIQRQKPALRLDEGVFNDDFQGFAIRIGDKKADGQRIEDVLIYDHKASDDGAYSQIRARSGKMFTTPDQRYFVMRLHDGHQYVEPRAVNRGSAASPFIRTNFQSWTRVFDLSEFDLKRTNEELFKGNRNMLSIAELQATIDSMAVQIEERRNQGAAQLASYIALPAPDTAQSVESNAPADIAAEAYRDTTGPQLYADTSMHAGEPGETPGALKRLSKQQEAEAQHRQTFVATLSGITPVEAPAGPVQRIRKPLKEYDSLLETFDAADARRFQDGALSFARNALAQAEANASILSRMKKNWVKFIYELHMKYVFAAMCVVFLFIGSPMGAIVRKGGFGFPILISTIFFVLFVILTILCRKIAEAFVVSGQLAAWIPCIVFVAIGAYLTLKAMNDSELFRFEGLRYASSRALGHLKRAIAKRQPA